MVKRLALLAAALLGVCMTAPAAVIVTITQQGSNVEMSASGTLNITGLNWFDTGDYEPQLSAGTFGIGSATTGALYYGVAPPGAIGPPGQTIYPSSSSGAGFLVAGSVLAVPIDFITGNAITGQSTYNNHTFSSLGLTTGTYVWTLPSDTITLQVTQPAVPTPEPASLAMMGGALLALSAYARRKQ